MQVHKLFVAPWAQVLELTPASVNEAMSLLERNQAMKNASPLWLCCKDFAASVAFVMNTYEKKPWSSRMQRAQGEIPTSASFIAAGSVSFAAHVVYFYLFIECQEVCSACLHENRSSFYREPRRFRLTIKRELVYFVIQC